MFQGANELKLNYATVIKATQEYFDKRLGPEAEHLKVVSISPQSDNVIVVHTEGDKPNV